MTGERQALSPLLCSAIAALDPWCSGPTCQPVTLEIAGSNPVGSAISASTYAPSARPDGAFPCLSRPRAGCGQTIPANRSVSGIAETTCDSRRM